MKHAKPGTQIARVKPEDPRFDGPPWIFEDNKGGGTFGGGASPESAFLAYLGKGGKNAPSAPPDDLTADELAQAAHFEQNVSPPTSVRLSNQGWYCDAFRPSGFHGKVPEGEGAASYSDAIKALRAKLGDDF